MLQNNLCRLLITLPTMCTLACGDIHPEREVEAELALETVLDEVASPEQHQQAMASLAEQIATHPAYAELSTMAFTRVRNVLDASGELSELEREQGVERMEECADGLDWDLCTNELYALGAERELSVGEYQRGQQLDAAFGLTALAMADRMELLRQAQIVYAGNGGAMPGLGFVPDSFGGILCDDACKGRVLANLDAGHAGTMAYYSEGGDEGDGGWILLFVAGLILIVTIGSANDSNNDDIFDGNLNNQCFHDSDCMTDEWCWKGPLGIGHNECRPDKENGEPCGRDAKCLSGCCNFNLFGSKCAVPNKCN